MVDFSQKNEDINLVKRALKNPDFYSGIVLKYEQRIIYYIIRISGVNIQEAEDVAQEVFLKAYLNLNAFDQEKKFSTWLFSIAHNEVISHWRKNKKRLKDLSIEGEELINKIKQDFDLDKQIDMKQKKEKVMIIIKNLDIKYREVLELRFIQEYSYEEISDVIKKPVSTVGTLINRARKIIKKELNI